MGQTSSSSSNPSADELLRKLLGKNVNDVHFHVFSHRSKSRVLRPRVLSANTTLLKSSSEYFADLFSSDVIPSNMAMVNIATTDTIFDGIDLSEYGYESDSDLEDDTDITASPTQTQVTAGSDSDNEDSGIGVPTTPSLEKDYDFFQQNVSSVTSEGPAGVPLNFDMPCGLGGGRHILVKDTAFQTWYCLLHFLYMGTTDFSPLRSSGPQESTRFSFDTSQVPKCSAKSMYRLATKLNIDELHSAAILFIGSNIDENNLLQELGSGFTGRYPDVLEMELDLLVEKLASPPIVEGLPKLMTRISQKELSHGADIMVGFYRRILQQQHLSGLSDSTTAAPSSPEPAQGSSGGAARDSPPHPASPSAPPVAAVPVLGPVISAAPSTMNLSPRGRNRRASRW